MYLLFTMYQTINSIKINTINCKHITLPSWFPQDDQCQIKHILCEVTEHLILFI